MKNRAKQRMNSHAMRKAAILRKEDLKYKDGLGRQRKIARDNER